MTIRFFRETPPSVRREIPDCLCSVHHETSPFDCDHSCSPACLAGRALPSALALLPVLALPAGAVSRDSPRSSLLPRLFPPLAAASRVDGAREMHEATPKNNHNRLQSIVDLLMWRDIPKTALVFGLGTFILVSSSYARDLNFSLISATSYLGLIYLALIFFYKSILRRGELDYDERDERYMVGEEEAIWILRLLLPYLNEVLLKMRALFSGDPATTMKMAVLLFTMAKCGNSITIWTLSKLIFFVVFTVPKICTSYSTQLLKFGKFWVARFRDGWQSCTHKKAVAAAIFTLIWNISSTAARIWAVFMLVVALKLYQQRLSEGWGNQEGEVVVENLAMAREADPKPGRPRYKRNEAMGENKPKKRI